MLEQPVKAQPVPHSAQSQYGIITLANCGATARSAFSNSRRYLRCHGRKPGAWPQRVLVCA